MIRSEQLDKFATALAKAQSEMAGAKKAQDNPFFKSKYADLTEVWKACKDALHDNGFSVVQSPISEGDRIGVTTLLLHSSGQYVQDSYTIAVKKQNDPQADGSSITYARRYALAAFVGVCPEDDDGEKAMARNYKPTSEPFKPVSYTPAVRESVDKYVAQIAKLETLAEVEAWLKKNEPNFSAAPVAAINEIMAEYENAKKAYSK